MCFVTGNFIPRDQLQNPTHNGAVYVHKLYRSLTTDWDIQGSRDSTLKTVTQICKNIMITICIILFQSFYYKFCFSRVNPNACYKLQLIDKSRIRPKLYYTDSTELVALNIPRLVLNNPTQHRTLRYFWSIRKWPVMDLTWRWSNQLNLTRRCWTSFYLSCLLKLKS